MGRLNHHKRLKFKNTYDPLYTVGEPVGIINMNRVLVDIGEIAKVSGSRIKVKRQVPVFHDDKKMLNVVQCFKPRYITKIDPETELEFRREKMVSKPAKKTTAKAGTKTTRKTSTTSGKASTKKPSTKKATKSRKEV